MTDFLVKYKSGTGTTSIVDPNNDPISAKSIILEGQEFDKYDIATVESLNNLEVNVVSASGFLQNEIDDLQTTVDSNQNGVTVEIASIREYERADFEAFQLLADDVKAIQDDNAYEELSVAVSGQTIVTLSGFTISLSNQITDFMVFVNGIKKTQSKTGVSGFGFDFKKNDATHFEFFSPLNANDKVVARKERTLTNSNRVTYFRDYVTEKTGRSVPLSQRYRTGIDGIWLFRNGIYLSKTRTFGLPVDRFDEASSAFLTVDATLENYEVMTAVNLSKSPTYRFYDEGVSGVSLTVPSYTTGNDRLLVFRNGLLMTSSGLGDAIERYTESSSTSVTLDVSATEDELFSFEYLDSISWREDQVVVSGTTINFANPYVIGDDRLLLFRDGVLMYKSGSLGDPEERYSESTTTTVTLVQSASGEVFSAIYL